MDEIGANSSQTRVGILAIPGFALMSYACTVEPLRAANLISGQILYDICHFASAETTQSSGAAMVAADHNVGSLPKLDYLFVIAGGNPMAFDDAPTFAWLRKMAARGTQIAGVSGGPVILAKAGLLSDRRMTVHWEHAAALAEFDPTLLIERSLFVIDRERLTCGGGTAPMDMMIALIAARHGGVFAHMVGDWFLHTDFRPSGGPQRSGLTDRLGTTSAPILSAVTAMETHVADPLSLDQLAQIAGTSPRQLNRLFREKLGDSTMSYYRTLRLDTARQLISHSPLPLTEIALATGFAGSAHFSSAYDRQFGVPPSKHRR